MDLEQIIQSDPRLQGWRPLAGSKPAPEIEQKTVTNVNGSQSIVPTPTGRYFLTLVDGNGNTRKVTARAGGIDPAGNVTNWGIEDLGSVERAPTTTADTKGGPLTDFQPIPGPDGKTPAKLYNPKTGQVIDLPDLPSTVQRPQVVGDAKNGYFAWDGSNLKPLTAGQPDKPQVIQGERGAVYSWDGKNLTTVKAPEAKPRDVAVVDNQLVDKNTGQVIYTAPQGVKFQTAQDGTILAIDPSNPTNVQPIWSPDKPRELVPGQSTTQPNLLQRDPKTGDLVATPNPIYGQGNPTTSEVSGQQGPKILQKVVGPDGSVSYQAVDNPAYAPAGQQALQEYLDGIKQVEGMVASGQLNIGDANQYKTRLRQQYDAKLQGTTPYQMQQDQQAMQMRRMDSAQQLLNQRVSSGTSMASSLLNSALGIVGNKNFMDPGAVSGLSIFGGATSVPDFINRLGGGQGVGDAATSALQSGLSGQQPQQISDPAMALLTAALNKPNIPAAQPSYGGMNIGSGAASNPQPPMGPTLAAPLGRVPESAAASTARNAAALQGNDPASILLRQALGGMM